MNCILKNIINLQNIIHRAKFLVVICLVSTVAGCKLFVTNPVVDINKNYRKKYANDFKIIDREFQLKAKQKDSVKSKKDKKFYLQVKNRKDIHSLESILAENQEDIKQYNAGEQYFPFVESEGYNVYNQANSSLLDSQQEITNNFVLHYYQVNYGPFVDSNNPFDSIKVLAKKQEEPKEYQIPAQEIISTNITEIANKKANPNKEDTIKIIEELDK
jgi:hypothetical protein